ncbi:MAG: hypothetical protein KH632_09110 [Sutterella wadsworthensis]|uniref:hypothetical protein n=1 Tax=Sutterella wadsworthensis TaxID=40545 RepID=UPI00307F3D4D|nr:hypothetical protein [Sutterella wadsworthensis]
MSTIKNKSLRADDERPPPPSLKRYIGMILRRIPGLSPNAIGMRRSQTFAIVRL